MTKLDPNYLNPDAENFQEKEDAETSYLLDPIFWIFVLGCTLFTAFTLTVVTVVSSNP